MGRSTRLCALRLGAAGADIGEHTGFGDGGLGGDVRICGTRLRERADREADDDSEEGEAHDACSSMTGVEGCERRRLTMSNRTLQARVRPALYLYFLRSVKATERMLAASTMTKSVAHDAPGPQGQADMLHMEGGRAELACEIDHWLRRARVVSSLGDSVEK